MKKEKLTLTFNVFYFKIKMTIVCAFFQPNPSSVDNIFMGGPAGIAQHIGEFLADGIR